MVSHSSSEYTLFRVLYQVLVLVRGSVPLERERGCFHWLQSCEEGSKQLSLLFYAFPHVWVTTAWKQYELLRLEATEASEKERREQKKHVSPCQAPKVHGQSCPNSYMCGNCLGAKIWKNAPQITETLASTIAMDLKRRCQTRTAESTTPGDCIGTNDPRCASKNWLGLPLLQTSKVRDRWCRESESSHQRRTRN